MVQRVSGPPPVPVPRVSRKEAQQAFNVSVAPQRPTAAPPAPPDGPTVSVSQLVSDLEQQRRDIDRLIGQATRGRSFSPAQLLALQSRVYTYSQEMEVVSRMVDRAVSAVKTTLNTQI